MEALLAFGAGLVTLRLAGGLLSRWRARPAPELLAWSGALLAYALAAAALAWGTAHGWDATTFRVYYVFGALLTAPLLGVGSLLLTGRRWAGPTGLVYLGLAVGVALAVPVHGVFGDEGIPAAQDHLSVFPARVLAIAGNSLGTLAVVAVALATFGRRPLGNGLILAGVSFAAVGSALAGLGAAESAAFVTAGALLLYGGFVAGPRRLPEPNRAPTAAS